MNNEKASSRRTRFLVGVVSIGFAGLMVGACSGSGDPSPVVFVPPEPESAEPSPAPPAAPGQVFETIYHDLIALPDGVQPWAPTWSPDGEHISFNNIADGTQWIVDKNGTGLFCLTCQMDDVPKITGAFSYIFPDNKRLFHANELGDKAYVLECAPSLYECSSHQSFLIDLSADVSNPAKPSLGRRTYHLAPDGVHLAYSMVRLDALIMMVAELQRTADGYVAANPKVINPAGPVESSDTSVDAWAKADQLYELKGFADGGASILIASEPNGVLDLSKLDLATGAITRMTHNPDWDEDGAISPDGQYLSLASWRTMHRQDVMGMLPIPSFFNYPLTSLIAVYYVSSFPGFQCDLQPWLLPADGDRGATLIGQPLNPYAGGDIITGNNLASLSFWSPDSTRILIQERLTTPPASDASGAIKAKGYSPNRLKIARIDRDPTEAQPVVSSAVGDWALSPADHMGAYLQNSRSVLIQGAHSGSIALTYSGDLRSREAFTATYSDYSEDGERFASGTTSLTLTGGLAAPNPAVYATNLVVKDSAGKALGSQIGDVQFRRIQPTPPEGQPPTAMSSTLVTSFNGQTAAPLPQVGPCMESLPRPNALLLDVNRGDGRLTVKVSANIAGDVRPVRRAVVTVEGTTARTDDAGLAHFKIPSSGEIKVEATAGDTFLAATTVAAAQ